MQLEEVGIKAKVRVWDLGVLREKAKNGERSLCFLFWLSSSLVPDGIIIPKLQTKDVANFSQYSNKRVDELFRLASTTMDQDNGSSILSRPSRSCMTRPRWFSDMRRRTSTPSAKK